MTTRIRHCDSDNGALHLRRLFRAAIREQRAMLRLTGQEPTWEVFAGTFGWHQMKRMMSDKMQKLYEEIWRAGE